MKSEIIQEPRPLIKEIVEKQVLPSATENSDDFLVAVASQMVTAGISTSLPTLIELISRSINSESQDAKDRTYLLQVAFERLKRFGKNHSFNRLDAALSESQDYMSYPESFRLWLENLKYTTNQRHGRHTLNFSQENYDRIFPNTQASMLLNDDKPILNQRIFMQRYQSLTWIRDHWQAILARQVEIETKNKSISTDLQQKVYHFWATGFDDAPEMVQAVVAHNQAQVGQDLLCLDLADLDQLIDIPDQVLAFKEARLPGNAANFSDWARVALLARYGGFWVDPTVIINPGAMGIFETSQTYPHYFVSDREYKAHTHRFINYLIGTEKGNRLASLMQAGMELYMREVDHFEDYFFMDFIFAYGVASDNTLEELVAQSPYFEGAVLDVMSHIHGQEVAKNHEVLLNQAFQTPFVKTTYKSVDQQPETSFAKVLLRKLQHRNRGGNVVEWDYHPEFDYQGNQGEALPLEEAKRVTQTSEHGIVRRFGGSKDLSYYPLNWLTAMRNWPGHAQKVLQAPKTDLVSVVITTYNRLEYLKTTIASVLNSQHQHFEFIIVDDGSTDGTIDFLAGLSSTEMVSYKPIFKQQSGYRVNKLEGIKASTGDYLIVCDDDDFYINDTYIDRAIITMKETGCGAVLHNAIELDFDTKKLDLPLRHPRGLYRTGYLVGNEQHFYGLAQGHIFDGQQFRQNLPSNMRSIDDESITLVGMLSGKVMIYDDYSILYRKRAGQISQQQTWESQYRYNAETYALILSEMVSKDLISSTQYFKVLTKSVMKNLGREYGEEVALDFLSKYMTIAPTVPRPRLYIFGVPQHGNLGDQAIAEATNQFVSRHTDFEIVEIPYEVSHLRADEISQLWGEGDLIAWHGGGNMGTLWPNEEARRQEVLGKFKDKPIVLFPQSIWFDQSQPQALAKAQALYNDLENATLFTREQKSFDFASEHFASLNNLLVPDIVFSMPCEDKGQARDGVMSLLRRDLEKSLSQDSQTILLEQLDARFDRHTKSDTVINQFFTDLNDRGPVLESFLNQMASHEVIVTDRLHGMIFAYLTGTPCVVFENSYHKIAQTYDNWISDCQWIKLIREISDLDDAINHVLAHRDQEHRITDDAYQRIIDVLTDKTPKIGIMMLTYNAPDYVKETITTLQKTAKVDYELIVVDNDSDAETKDLLRDLKAQGLIDTLKFNDENRLFAGGNNDAFDLVSADVTHVLLLNSDIKIISPDWLKKLMAIHPKNGGISALGYVGYAPYRADGYCLLIDRSLYNQYRLDENFQWWWGVTKLQAQVLSEGKEVVAVKNHEDLIHHYGGGSTDNVQALKQTKGMAISIDEVQKWFEGLGIKVVDHLN